VTSRRHIDHVRTINTIVAPNESVVSSWAELSPHLPGQALLRRLFFPVRPDVDVPVAESLFPAFSRRAGHFAIELRGGGLRLAVSLKNMASNQELHRKPVSVVIADDHPVVLQGITEILRAQADISVVAACNGGRDATAAIQQFTPDVAVLEIIMPDLSGLDVLLSIVGDRFKTRVVLLTAVATDDRILAAMTGGAKGLLFKDAAPDNLIDCVREVAKGKLWFPHGLVDAAPERESGRQADGECSIGVLTPREAQIALLVSEGLSNKLVAWQLKMAEGTVKVLLHNIFEKLGIPNRTVLCALTIPHRDWLLAAAEHARAKLN
jgi:two-component system, NarL family, nitrate/nitrite response regulator NarL